MKRFLMLAALTVCGGFAVADVVSASITHYSFPVNIALELKRVDTNQVDAVVEPRIGVPSDVRLFFESSDDVRLEPGSATIDRLNDARPGRFRLTVTGTGRPADASGSWIRLRAVYLPDYDALIEAVSDTKDYPDDGERQRLIDIATRNKASRAVYTDATRLDIERTNALRRTP
ncbi:hypothetical protein KBA41_02440 [Candidatus Ozemobacteraceae bacterium]|nr:hypothetical protein [Candidatus Ozemobacteraceae bacterium]